MGLLDTIKPAERNYLLGLLADGLQSVNAWAQKPTNTQQLQGLPEMLGLTGTQRTLNKLSYGDPITNIGKANVPIIPQDTLDAAMAIGGLLDPAAKVANAAAAAVGKRVAPAVESMVNSTMRNGGPGAQFLRDMSQGTQSPLTALEKPFVYPQDKALATAQANAAKPISEGGLGLRPDNTPMERAKAMGYEDTFHGSKTPEGIKNLTPGGENGSIRTGDAYGTGVYTTTDAAGDASSYGAGGAVFPLKIDRSNHLKVDAPNADDLNKLSKFSGEKMLPSDKARFSIGRETRTFQDVQDARDFFSNQRENWKQFGGGYDRARPEAIANSDGTFAVQFTNFDAPVPITNGKDAETLLKATGWDNVPALGYSGHTLDRGAGRLWDVTPDTRKLRSRFAAFDPARRNEADLLGGASPELLALIASGGLLGIGGYNASKP